MSDLLLAVRHLTVRYGGVIAVDHLDLTVGRGEVVGLIGPNGAGKTTCIDALTGFVTVDDGQIELDGRRIDGDDPHERARAGFARTFQSLELFDDLDVRANVAVGATAAGHRGGAPTVDEVLVMTGLSAVSSRDAGELSNGERHRVALARSLAGNPELLLLDEPAAGLDEDETAELRAVLSDLPARGVSLLVVDHDMSLIFGACDRVYVLDFGRLIAEGPPAAVRRDRAVVEAYLGGSGVDRG